MDPAWYLRLQPDIAPDITARRRLPVAIWFPEPPYAPERYVGVGLGFEVDRVDFETKVVVSRNEYGTSWVINDLGEEVAETRAVGDSYNRNQNLPDGHPDKINLPDPEEFELVPMKLADVMPGSTYTSPDMEDDRP